MWGKEISQIFIGRILMKKKTGLPVLAKYVSPRNFPEDKESLNVVFPNTAIYEAGKPLCHFWENFPTEVHDKIKSFLQGKKEYTHYFLRMLGNNSEIVIEVR